MVWGHNHSHPHPGCSVIDFRNATKILFRIPFTHPPYRIHSLGAVLCRTYNSRSPSWRETATESWPWPSAFKPRVNPGSPGPLCLCSLLPCYRAPTPRCSKSSPFLLSSHWQAWTQRPWGLHYTQGFILPLSSDTYLTLDLWFLPLTLACPGSRPLSPSRKENRLPQDTFGTWTPWRPILRVLRDSAGSRFLTKETHTSPRVKSGEEPTSGWWDTAPPW